MRMWFASVAIACGCSIAVVQAVSAQAQDKRAAEAQAAEKAAVEVQRRVQAVQAIQIQAQPVQIQVQGQPGNAGIAFDRIAVMPGPGVAALRMNQADAVFVGRVVALEPMDVESLQTPKGAKANYRVAVVEVSESVFGLKKETKMVRVAFIAQPNNVPGAGAADGVGNVQIQIQPGGGFGGRRPFPGNFQMTLQVGQDGLFTVNKHHKENFYLSPAQQNFVTRQGNANFDNEVKTAKQLGKVIGNPVASLKAEDKQDRYTAASILVSKYRSNPTGQPMKLVAIEAEESKLILKALAEGDWTPGRFNAAIASPFELFNQLGITQNDGYNPVNIQNQQQLATAMQKWLDENNGKYRIQKLVLDPNAKVQPGVDPAQPQPGVIRPGGIRPIRIQPGKVQILPAPVPQPVPAPIEIEIEAVPADLPAQPEPARKK